MDREDYQTAETAFIEGFRQVSDKLGFLRLARIPLEVDVPGEPSLKLMQVALKEVFDVGRASPGFGSRELVYYPLPGKLVTSTTGLTFRYVSATAMRELTFVELLARSNAEEAHETLSNHHCHHHHHHEHDHAGNGAAPPSTTSP